jgi:hypothetical protein
VRYVHLQEVPDQYSMGIFVFPPYAKIPLHDHPGMCVVSRILYGDLQRLSLDLPRDEDAAPKKPNHGFPPWMSWSHLWASAHHHQPPHPQRHRRLAYRKKRGPDRLAAPDCAVLYPREGNLHEFVAGPHGAAVLDVLVPPYDADRHRDCTFYDIHDCDDPLDSLINGGDRRSTMTEHGQPCWIVPTGQPEDFHCISGQYRELGG